MEIMNIMYLIVKMLTMYITEKYFGSSERREKANGSLPARVAQANGSNDNIIKLHWRAI
jgi:hypothetical protein